MYWLLLIMLWQQPISIFLKMYKLLRLFTWVGLTVPHAVATIYIFLKKDVQVTPSVLLGWD